MKFARALAAAAVATTLIAAPTVAAAPADLSEQDTTWMVAAHQSNLAEIAAGQAAQSKASSQAVKDLGAMFVEMHTALDADLTAAASELSVTLPPAPTPEQQAELAAVTAQQGAAFDTAWVAQQIGAHQKSLAATQTEVAEGSNATVVGLANAATPVVRQHLTELQAQSSGAGAPTAIPTGSGGQAASSASNAGLLFAALGAVAIIAAAGWALSRRRRAA